MVTSVQWYFKNLAAFPAAEILFLNFVLRSSSHKWEWGFRDNRRLLLDQMCVAWNSEVLAKQEEGKAHGRLYTCFWLSEEAIWNM